MVCCKSLEDCSALLQSFLLYLLIFASETMCSVELPDGLESNVAGPGSVAGRGALASGVVCCVAADEVAAGAKLEARRARAKAMLTPIMPDAPSPGQAEMMDCPVLSCPVLFWPVLLSFYSTVFGPSVCPSVTP